MKEIGTISMCVHIVAWTLWNVFVKIQHDPFASYMVLKGTSTFRLLLANW